MLQMIKEWLAIDTYVDLYIGTEEKRRVRFYILPDVGDLVLLGDMTVKIIGRVHESTGGAASFYLSSAVESIE